MRAAVIEKPHTLVVKDVPVPQCGEDELLVKLHRAAICNESDWEVYAGTSSIIDYIGGYPHILGHEQSGEVVEVGKAVQGYTVGDRITVYWKGTGAFAEYNTFNPSKLAVVKLDDRVSYSEGALLEIAGGGAMRNAYGSGLRPTDTTVVMGVGPAGLLTGMVSKLFGAKAWVAIDLVDFRLQKALEVGAAAAFNVREMSHPEIVEGIASQVGQVDIVFETMGEDRSPGQTGLDLAVKIVKPGGDVRLFTFSDSRHQFNIGDVLMKGVNFVGRKVTTEKSRELLDLAQHWVAEGRYPIEKLITHRLSLDEVEKGLKLAKEQPEETIKVIIDIC
jgi:2-desacetyl-2-hydroxyethyl bacteriochlorophyllide A dehydrogenase